VCYVAAVTASEVRATSFGQVADDYDRLRPGPAPAALDWLVPSGCAVAVDLAAGTGLFTRALRPWVTDVIAVEPDDRMRAVLAARSPGVRAVAGRGEAIPLPDASVDALFISSAWHWLDHDLAVPEIARVLRDGGRLGVLWTSRDRHTDWVADLERRREPGPADQAAQADKQARRRRQVTLPENGLFENLQHESFTFTRTMAVDDAVNWYATYSGLITATDEDRAAALAQVRAGLLSRAGADDLVEIPMRSACWRADRIARN
jgi:SAM-dependent methyltransferase